MDGSGSSIRVVFWTARRSRPCHGLRRPKTRRRSTHGSIGSSPQPLPGACKAPPPAKLLPEPARDEGGPRVRAGHPHPGLARATTEGTFLLGVDSLMQPGPARHQSQCEADVSLTAAGWPNCYTVLTLLKPCAACQFENQRLIERRLGYEVERVEAFGLWKPR